ncbi:uncharacterized protein PRCAT00000740001 [Priceomyces carsonii]|uniref:uncharacterized protein n=1 Tax=Priceomyces carsonii TaxID=28549 RepID=UPI002ED78163|nr:unnamed protein product [Priceomyces carsonii]
MSGNEQVLNDIRGKIDRERKLIQGFQSLKRNTNNSEVIQRCNTQIREAQSNIDYLQEALSKVTLQQCTQNEHHDEGSDSPVRSSDSRPLYSRFDLIKYDCPSLGHKIQYMLQQLQFKRQVENQYKEANEKISHLYLMDGDKSSSSAAEGGKMESDQRIQLLNKSLKRYQDMHVNIEEVTRDMEIMNTPKYARKPLSGKLTATISCIRDIDHIASPVFSKRPESIVCIKIDDVEKARTRPSRSGKWNEEFTIDVDKGNEIEFSVYDKSGNSSIPVAINWASLSDITEELRKKKVANELGSGGWISASNLSGTTLTGKQPNNDLTSNFGRPMAGGAGAGLGAGTGASNANDPYSSNSVSLASTEGASIQITTWLSLEPVGQILLSLSFEKSNQKGRKQFMGALGRHGAIRQKKEEVYEQHGHHFVLKPMYNIMCCALCGEFLRYTGFQCQDCKFLCHKKCYPKVVTKCLANSSSGVDDDATKLNHRIPHRFEPILNRGTKWCCHCGYILPWGRKNVRKCTECGVMCHASCTHLVPDFCGMSMEMANEILRTIESTKAPAPKPLPTPGKKFMHKQLPSKGIVTHSQSDLPPLPQDVSPIKTDSTLDRSDTLRDEDVQDREYASKLPTVNANNVQEPPIDSQYAKASARRPPPDLSYGDDTRDATGIPLQYQEEDNPFNDRMEGVNDSSQIKSNIPNSNKMELDNFDYGNKKTQQYIIQDDAMHQNTLVLPNISPEKKDGGVDQSMTKPSTKSKRRRRKVGLDDFQFLAVLGKGNFGKVMLAESRHTQNLCAIKVLKKDFIVENDEADSVKSEKRVFLTANKEMHPFLLNLHCCFQTENRIYFVMEYISGGDLMWHIQKSRFSAKRAKFYACEVVLALKYFHENGIVYRDLKLDNILLTTKGHIKIADYGLCKEKMWYKNTTSTFCGTPEFMAPEIIAGKPYDRSVDWWAFGVLLFQMLLCQSPFKGDDEDEIFNAIEHDDVKYPISMPRQTVLVLQALLTKDPAQRLGSGERDADEVMEHLYFLDVNFDDVYHCRVQAPYLPEVSSEHDYSNFDQEFTSETPRLTPVETILTSEMQEQFRGFSHIAGDAAI